MMKKYVNQKELFLFVGCTIGLFLFGSLLHDAILHFFPEPDTTVFPLGSFLTILIMVLISVLAAGSRMLSRFNMEISMGATRKEFFVGCVAQMVLLNAINGILLLVLSKMEAYKLQRFYPDYEVELEIEAVVQPMIVFCLAIVLVSLSIFFMAFILRLGKNGFWAIWGLYMVGCLGMAKFGDRIEFSGNVALDYMKGNGVVFVLGILVFAVLCIAGSWLMIRKQAVQV